MYNPANNAAAYCELQNGFRARKAGYAENSARGRYGMRGYLQSVRNRARIAKSRRAREGGHDLERDTFHQPHAVSFAHARTCCRRLVRRRTWRPHSPHLAGKGSRPVPYCAVHGQRDG